MKNYSLLFRNAPIPNKFKNRITYLKQDTKTNVEFDIVWNLV